MSTSPLAERHLDATTRQVLLEVLLHGPVARADLARALDLSAPTVTRAAKSLLEQGLIIEGEPVAPATTGRPSLPLAVDAAAASFVGGKITTGALHLVLVDLCGQVLRSHTMEGVTGSRDDTIRALGEWITALAGEGVRPRAVGLSLAATVDAEGMTTRSAYLGWESGPLGAVAAEALGLPCVADNDVNAFTVAEHWFGHGRGVGEFAVVTVGLGTGLGLVTNDELVRGYGGAAGQIGKLRTLSGDLLTEQVESAPLARAAGELLGRTVVRDELPALRREPACQGLWASMATAVGELVATTSMVVAPQRVLVSGENADLLHDHLDALWLGFDSLAGAGTVRPELAVQALDFTEWARGAAAVAIRQTLLG